ncbi:hypothetical protein C0J52_23899, partial [Blattella germanica]
ITFPKAVNIHPKSFDEGCSFTEYSIPLLNRDTISPILDPRVPERKIITILSSLSIINGRMSFPQHQSLKNIYKGRVA